MVTILRSQLEDKAGELVEARNRIAELEHSQTKLDAVVVKADEALSGSNAISSDLRQVTRQAAVLSDNLLIANARADLSDANAKECEFKARNAAEWLMSVENELVAAKEMIETTERMETQVKAEKDELIQSLKRTKAEISKTEAR